MSWTTKRIGELGEVVTGTTPSTTRADYYGGSFNLISPADLDNGIYVRTAHRRLTQAGFEQCRALPKDAVLVGCIGNVGKLGMVADERSATNQQINALICGDGYDPHFIYYSLRANVDRLRQAAVMTTVPLLNKSNFGNVELEVPDLLEQQRIANALNGVQAAIEQQERLIRTTTELKQALMQKLFTEGLRGEAQKETEIGLVPKSWEVVKVMDTGTVVTGSTPRTSREDFYGGEYNLISPGDLDVTKYVVAVQKKLTALGFDQCRKLPKGAVLVGCIGNVGKVGIVADDWSATNQQINAIVPNERFSGEFLYYAMGFHRKRLEGLAGKVTIPLVNKSNFERFEIAAPLLADQETIAKAIDAVDQRIAIAEKKRNALQDLFRTLLHELMTGKVRVGELDLVA